MCRISVHLSSFGRFASCARSRSISASASCKRVSADCLRCDSISLRSASSSNRSNASSLSCEPFILLGL